jgi:phage baseplate assembly protein W
MTIVQGISFPLTLDSVRGTLKLSSGADLVRDKIISFLKTEPLERVMRPEYGTQNYLFESAPSIEVIASEIERRLISYIPQATFSTIGSLNDDGELLIEIYWSLSGVEQDPILLII